ncbi:hypothetical protein, partial [Gordonia sp. NPDC127522]|uniref:hypothetical protein n=1 Tax=Gordonia sp. NPDC127522 TaxID=3345390 RepID=UPI003632A500
NRDKPQPEFWAHRSWSGDETGPVAAASKKNGRSSSVDQQAGRRRVGIAGDRSRVEPISDQPTTRLG